MGRDIAVTRKMCSDKWEALTAPIIELEDLDQEEGEPEPADIAILNSMIKASEKEEPVKGRRRNRYQVMQSINPPSEEEIQELLQVGQKRKAPSMELEVYEE